MGRAEGHGWPVLLNVGPHLDNNCVILLVRQQHLLGTDSLLRSSFTITLSEPSSLRYSVRRTSVFISEQAVSVPGPCLRKLDKRYYSGTLPSGWCSTPPGFSSHSVSHSLTVFIVYSIHFIHSLPPSSIH